MSRTRTRDTISHSFATQWWNIVTTNPGVAFYKSGWLIPAGTSTCLSSWANMYTSLGAKSVMTDSLTPSGASRGYNACTHTVDEWKVPLIPLVPKVWKWTHPVTPSLEVTNSLIGGYASARDGLQSPPSASGLSTTVLEAYATAQMRPGVPEKILSVPQMIGELVEMRSLYSGAVENLFKGLKQFVSDPSAILSMVYKQQKPLTELKPILAAMGRGAGGAFQGHLVYKLVLVPFIRDMQNLARAGRELDKAYARLQNPKPYTVKGGWSNESYSAPTTTTGTLHKAQTITRRDQITTTWALVVNHPVTIPEMELLKHRLGWAVQVSTAWELTPLSFVFDWFVNVGRWIRQFEGQILTVPYTVLQSGVSHKDTSVTTTLTSPGMGTQAAWAGMTGTVVTGSRIKRSYVRQPKSLSFNTTLVPLTYGLPNLAQVGTLAEMVYLAFTRH